MSRCVWCAGADGEQGRRAGAVGGELRRGGAQPMDLRQLHQLVSTTPPNHIMELAGTGVALRRSARESRGRIRGVTPGCVCMRLQGVLPVPRLPHPRVLQGDADQPRGTGQHPFSPPHRFTWRQTKIHSRSVDSLASPVPPWSDAYLAASLYVCTAVCFHGVRSTSSQVSLPP